ncbi:ribonuclease domain-containing protein [Arenimonas oryziterrae]|uniref:Uncharacterized protein n=1 Tax=Arenimonas oryziterrae DSM 21050 = YC6267 TaxID=1121015 RepID=A0A091BHS2_9GAMM|nr:ribonuclease domain-containing protein [Arenimonas oryziterrae]KFN43895.1 hypothetical protein N789_08075 [Arenimonas oryziterrae DSM 21050 = YC6267]
MTRNRWLIVVLALFIGWKLIVAWQGQAFHPAPTAATQNDPAPVAAADDGLPPEAHTTLQLIQRGGPFPYERDGIVFGNFEHRLPPKERGYYHEYTVPTPGLNHRGPRRIITGGQPPDVFYYTDDHYETFRPIGGQP